MMGSTVVAAVLAVGCGASTTTTVGPSPSKCNVGLSAPASIGPSTGTATVTLSTQPECSWTASTASPWITNVTPASGQGSAQIVLDIAANPAPSVRDGELAVNDARLEIRQDPSPCLFTVSPSTASVPAAAGGASLSFAVSSLAGCNWVAATSTPWLTVASGSPGSGNGTSTTTVAANSGPARQGSLVVAGRIFTIEQASGCSYAIITTPLFIGAGGGAGGISLNTETGCTWNASSNVSWITVTSGASGSGAGSVGFSVAGNAGPQRQGTVAAAGLQYPVTQASGCTFVDIDPPIQVVGVFGGQRTVAITPSAPGCTWTATSQVSWISILSGESGSGQGTVVYFVQPWGGSSRHGEIRISSDTSFVTHTVMQN
jgi:hypothetical protein